MSISYATTSSLDVPHGQEDIINGDGPLFKVRHSAYHTKFACQLLGRTMAAVLLWGTPLYPSAGAPFYLRNTQQRRKIVLNYNKLF